MQRISVSDITAGNIRNNSLAEALPEFYELKDVVENNPWHNNDSVFDHTLSVMERLEVSLSSASADVSDYLNQAVAVHTRRDLLFLVALLHDIGKKETAVTEGAATYCPGHEEVGARKAYEIVLRFGVYDYEKEIVVDIIRYHGIIHQIVRPDNQRLDEEFSDFRAKYPEIFLELILLGKADTEGSHLASNNPQEYKFRIGFYENVLDGYR